MLECIIFCFFSQLLHNFCKENGIDESKKFYELNNKTQELILNSRGENKYKISFNVNGRKRTKTTEYIGPILGMELGKKDMFGINQDKYSKQYICPECNGSRLVDSISCKNVIDGNDVRFMLTGNMDEVAKSVEKIKIRMKNSVVKNSCEYILKFIKACARVNISYLNLSRGISTLSGGELQRLRIVQLMLGKLKNLLIILDEPTGSLGSEEVDSLIEIIKELKNNNTVIVVDHNDKLRKIADRKYFLGPKSGINGGQIITEKEYEKIQAVSRVETDVKSTQKISITLKSEYVNYDNALIIYEKSLNGLCGMSGIGKSTILRDILPYQLDGYKYITQKPIKANSRSSVSSYTEILDEVKNYYSKKSKQDKRIFSLSQDGACIKCGGSGYFVIGDFYDEKLYADCEECEGTGYTSKTLIYKVNGLNIHEFLNQNVDQIIENSINISNKFDHTIQLLGKLGLGHLSLNQKISTLSGGENQRIKFLQALRAGRTKIYGLDEPSKGLGRKETVDLISVIYENIKYFGKTFIVAEHNRDFLEMCSYVNELVQNKGKVKVVQKL